MTRVIRLTVAQALVRFLAAQYTERDGVEHRLIAGAFGIFGHGNVAGVGQALLEAEPDAEPEAGLEAGLEAELAAEPDAGPDDPAVFPYVLVRNEQAMVHTAAAYARMRNRLSTWACTASIGPGSTNMVTGAAGATINRLPVLLLPSDVFATRPADPVLQQLEDPRAADVTVNDTFRPVARFFDRVWRPEQLPSALLGAMRVLTDQAETGAAVVALPQDVQTEAHDWPAALFEKRLWSIARPEPEPAALRRAVEVIRAARRPLIVSGGGTIYSEATEALRRWCDATGIPVAETQAGKGSLPYDHPSALGALGSTGTTAANRLARDADVVIGVGTRYSDFTTASRTTFQYPDVRFVNVNVAAFDAAKLRGGVGGVSVGGGVALVADARAALDALGGALAGWSVDDAHRDRIRREAAAWEATVDAAYHLGHGPRPAQSEVIGAVNDASAPNDVVVGAAGSLPGDLHKLWRTRDPKGYHVEYGYSCMGYEIAGGVGVRLACPDRDVFVMVGDGSYLMMAQELVTAVQEGVKVIVVVVDNGGFASIGALSEQVGSQRFGTEYRYRNRKTGRLDGERLPVDLAANAESLGARVWRARSIADLRTALAEAKAAGAGGPVVVHIETDPLAPSPASESWWDVPVAEVARAATTVRAREVYEEGKARQRRDL